MCGPNNQYFANTSLVTISVGTSSLTGTGASHLLTASNVTGAVGTAIQSITIKSTVTNSALGMIRVFVNNGIGSFLIREVMVPANTQTGVVQAFSYTINEPIMLAPGYELLVSTQNSDTFNVMAKGQDIISCGC